MPETASANASPFSFSTTIYRYGETDCDFVDRRRRLTTVFKGVRYYGYRFYNPELGRWINRDPIREVGGKNLYSFIDNNAVDDYDLRGLISIPDFIRLFIKYLLRNGDSTFGGYSDSVWEGILEHQSVKTYQQVLSAKAETMNKCCESYQETIPGRSIVDKSSFFNFTLSSLEAGLAIGSGSLDVGDADLKVECDDETCSWSASMTYTVRDKYSFKKFNEEGEELPWWHWDNNWFLRTFLLMDLWGKDFETSDDYSDNLNGTHSCVW